MIAKDYERSLEKLKNILEQEPRRGAPSSEVGSDRNTNNERRDEVKNANILDQVTTCSWTMCCI
jgi:hypothetical protein